MAGGSKIYTMSIDLLHRLISYFTILLLIGAFVVVCLSEEWFLIVLMAVITLGVTAWAICCSPQYLVVDDQGLGIRWRVGGRFIPLSNISEVKWLDADGPSNFITKSTRVWGNGGVFGYTGLMHNKQIGKYHIYARRMTGLVLVKCVDGKNVVVGCDEPQQLVADLTSRLATGIKVNA